MNVEDTKSPKKTGDMLEMIFHRQNELHLKYKTIEENTGLGLGLMASVAEFSIDNQRCQEVCKNYAWRITEELTESTEVMQSCPYLTDEVKLHAREEAMDALHFYVELLIIVDMSPQDLTPRSVGHMGHDGLNFLVHTNYYATYEKHRVFAYNTIEYLGKAMNCLKQKPWKQTHVFTDTRRFRYNLIKGFDSLIGYCRSLMMDDDMIYDLYFRKSEVNKFRQRSNY